MREQFILCTVSRPVQLKLRSGPTISFTIFFDPAISYQLTFCKVIRFRAQLPTKEPLANKYNCLVNKNT